MPDAAVNKKLYVVITDFNGWQQTETCLQRLVESTYQTANIVVVDHGTTNQTAGGLEAFPAVKRIAADSELWWTGATNVGIQYALKQGATHIMLLNNDCFVDRDTLEVLVTTLGDEQGQVIAPVQRSADSREILVARTGTCFSLGFVTVELPYMRRLPDGERTLATRMIMGGRGVIVPVGVFAKVGLFDADALPHYGADHDFYMRCRSSGIALRIAARASVEIDHTRTTVARRLGQMSFREFRGSLRNPRSHRNTAMLKTLFKRYYPIPPLFFVGLALNLMRYLGVYLISRLLNLFRK